MNAPPRSPRDPPSRRGRPPRATCSRLPPAVCWAEVTPSRDAAAPTSATEVARWRGPDGRVFAVISPRRRPRAAVSTVSTLVLPPQRAAVERRRAPPAAGTLRALRAQVVLNSLAGQLQGPPGGARRDVSSRSRARAAVTVPEGPGDLPRRRDRGEACASTWRTSQMLARPYVPSRGHRAGAGGQQPLAMQRGPPLTSRATRSTSGPHRGRVVRRRCGNRSRWWGVPADASRRDGPCSSSSCRWATTTTSTCRRRTRVRSSGRSDPTLHPNLMTMTEGGDPRVLAQQDQRALRARRAVGECVLAAPRAAGAPDPRPLHRRVVLAVHALQPVGGSTEAMIAAGHPWSKSPDFSRRYEQVKVNRDGAAVVLGSGPPDRGGEGALRRDAPLGRALRRVTAPQLAGRRRGRLIHRLTTPLGGPAAALPYAWVVEVRDLFGAVRRC